METERDSKSQENIAKFLLIVTLITWGSACLVSLLGVEGDGLVFMAMILVPTGAITTVLGLVAAFTCLRSHSWLKPGMFNSFWLPLLLAFIPVFYLIYMYFSE